jgi:hypothetical protein
MSVPIPQEPGEPGPPKTAWAPSLVVPSVNPPFFTGHLVLHVHHKVWYRMAAFDAYGLHAPEDAIALDPATPPDGMPDMEARLERIEDAIMRMRDK